MDPTSAKPEARRSRGLSFWLIIVALCTSLFCGALELTAVSTALPTIIDSIHGFSQADFVWVGSAYALSSTAFLPTSGNLAQIFGRRPVMIFALVMFFTGSALCGASRTRDMFIGGRVVQGLGGGGILSLTNIILADLVPLKERGAFNAFIGMTWGVAAAIGPVIGGGLAQHGAWRWIFYLNLPVSGIALVLVSAFLKLRTPRSSIRQKLSQFDWIGNILVISSSCSCILGLTWGGTRYPWSSLHVILPICMGFVGLCIFLAYELNFATNPIVASVLLSNRTSCSGYVQTFIIQAILVIFTYYMPVYFQACKDASPTDSGIDIFGFALALPPISVLGGFSIAAFKCYRPQLWVGWSLTLISMGLLTILTKDSGLGLSIGLGVIAGAGVGTAYTGTFFPVLAPLPVRENAHAISLGVFLRAFGQAWGVMIGGVVLQNQLTRTVPTDFLSLSSGSTSIAYSMIAEVRNLPQPLKDAVRSSFASSLRAVWLTLVGMSAVGLIASIPMKALPLHTDMDDDWGVSGEDSNRDLVKECEVEKEGV